MDKPTLSSIFPLPVLALGVIWAMFVASTLGSHTQPPLQQTGRGDTPEKILSHVRALQQPVVLLNFWASWCEPCKEELPALKQLQEKFLNSGLKVVLISIDDVAEIPEAESYLKDNNIAFTAFYKGGQSLKFVSKIYPQWSGAVPATVLMDRNLKVLDAWEGDTTFEEFEERVTRFLGGKT